jgi:hypothetical protein
VGLPNFLVIGAGRSGTTSLHHYLSQHPDVFLTAEKSPNFFVSQDPLPPWEGPAQQVMARQWVRTLDDYEALFAGAGVRAAVGEASPMYLQSRRAPARIAAACPEVRLVAILREPVGRAYAHFMGRRRDGLDRRTDFSKVVQAELSQPLPQDVAFGHYLGCGRYHHFLQGYFDRFPADRIRIYLYDDLLADASALVADLFAFLGVDPRFSPDMSRRYGQTGVPANPVARFVWTRSVTARTLVRPWLPRRVRDLAAPMFLGDLSRPPLDPSLHARVIDVFRDDIARLEGLLGRDLSHWLTVPAV